MNNGVRVLVLFFSLFFFLVERQAENNLDGVQGSKSDISGPEMSKGRKRTSSDSAFMGSLRDRMHQTEPLSPENMRLLKVYKMFCCKSSFYVKQFILVMVLWHYFMSHDYASLL